VRGLAESSQLAIEIRFKADFYLCADLNTLIKVTHSRRRKLRPPPPFDCQPPLLARDPLTHGVLHGKKLGREGGAAALVVRVVYGNDIVHYR
jgi:hypothetical protein